MIDDPRALFGSPTVPADGVDPTEVPVGARAGFGAGGWLARGLAVKELEPRRTSAPSLMA